MTPCHVGFIMDGNGRWAKKRNLPRTAGHIQGLKALKRVIVACRDRNIKYATFYAFSTENWKRSEQEVGYLMHLMDTKLRGELSFYLKNRIRVVARGDLKKLPEKVQSSLAYIAEKTKEMDGITCTIAVNYGGRDEIVRAANALIAEGRKEITEEDLTAALDLPAIPSADMIVRSAGEVRLSNFLLWDSAYAEFAFYEKLWPDWDEKMVDTIIEEYQKRHRKFGGTS